MLCIGVEMREAGKPVEQYDFQGRYAQVRVPPLTYVAALNL